MNAAIFGAGSAGRATVTTTVGYIYLAFCVWMLAMTNAGWFASVFPRTSTMLMPLAVILVIVGILAFLNERALDAVIFLGAAGYFWSEQGFIAATTSGGGQAVPHYDAWYSFIWAVLVAFVWFAARGADRLRNLFLLAIWLGLLALAIGAWAGVSILTIIGGYLGLIGAIFAALVSARAILAHANGAGAI